MKTIYPNSFDRGKPFYPLIMNFLIQLLGFKDLAVRGITGSPSIDEVVSQLGGKFSASNQQDLVQLRASMEGVMRPLELRSEFLKNTIRVNVDEIAKELCENITYLAESLFYALGAIFILTEELCKDKSWHNKDAMWEFLRHCRNAAGRLPRTPPIYLMVPYPLQQFEGMLRAGGLGLRRSGNGYRSGRKGPV